MLEHDAGFQIDGMLSEVAVGDAWAVGPWWLERGFCMALLSEHRKLLYERKDRWKNM